jgi:hypothetical protein
MDRFHHLAFDGDSDGPFEYKPGTITFWTAVINGVLAPFLLIAILLSRAIAAHEKTSPVNGMPHGRRGYNDCDVRCRYRHVCVVRMPPGSWAMPEPDAIPK